LYAFFSPPSANASFSTPSTSILHFAPSTGIADVSATGTEFAGTDPPSRPGRLSSVVASHSTSVLSVLPWPNLT
jgi:hypothetical protein